MTKDCATNHFYIHKIAEKYFVLHFRWSKNVSYSSIHALSMVRSTSENMEFGALEIPYTLVVSLVYSFRLIIINQYSYWDTVLVKLSMCTSESLLGPITNIFFVHVISYEKLKACVFFFPHAFIFRLMVLFYNFILINGGHECFSPCKEYTIFFLCWLFFF